jgi:hypothetical protein
MENRHAQEASSPPTGVEPQALAKQQATEHRTLDNNYVQARSSGARAMPAPPPRPAPPAPRPAAPAPRPAAPAPRPAAPPPPSRKPH